MTILTYDLSANRIVVVVRQAVTQRIFHFIIGLGAEKSEVCPAGAVKAAVAVGSGAVEDILNKAD